MEGAIEELNLQLHALRSVTLGPKGAVEALPSAGPDFSRELPVLAIYAFVFFVFSWGARFCVIDPLLTRCLGMRSAKLRRCSQSVMEAMIYGAFSVFGLLVVPSQPWVWPSERWWSGVAWGGHLVIRSDVRCYYLMYLARYVQMLISVMLEPRRKDFPQMVLHHLVTTVVVSVSYCKGWNRVGVVTMLLLDPTDVPLHIAKVCKYAAESTGKRIWRTLADRCFELFALTFFVTRLVMYTYVVYSVWTEGRPNVEHLGGFAGWVCFIILCILLVLQFFWFSLILKVAMRIAQGKPAEDVRSDDDESPAAASPPASGASSPWWPIVLGASMCGACAQQALSFGAERSLAEISALLHGLRVVIFHGVGAAASLPQASPDMDRDTLLTVVFTAGFFAINWGLRILVVEPTARWALGLRRSELQKFAQSVMEALFYSAFMLIGIAVVPSQEWVWPSWKWWRGFADGGHEVMRSDLRCYYIMYISRYIQAIFSVLLERKRKDFTEMIVHHLVTVTVIYISYVYGWNRVGVVVMVLLDPADVPLHLAKLCKYTAEATGRRIWQFTADRLFEIFALVFFVTRLVMYTYVCWSAHIEASRYFPKGTPEWACVALLYTLLILQVYWFFLIMKVALKLLRGQGVDDPRSDDDDDMDAKQRSTERGSPAGVEAKKER